MASVRVAVRVRPLNTREKKSASKVIIQVQGKTTTIHKPIGLSVRGDEQKTFSFDFSYDSTDPGSPSFASQEEIFHDLGSGVLKAAFEGFNTCIFTYGQTGSGKSYTMMGHPEDKGLIPRICEGLFSEISQRSKSDAVSYRTEVSYLEIYNERVQDLLRKNTTPTDSGGLRVREHPKDGPYVQNLSRHLVHNYSQMEQLILLGNANRTTATTDMNDLSSRSHAIFTIRFTQLPCETLSKIHLVDLAGSERADTTHTAGARLKEGANINKSLVALGCVISTLVLFQNIETTKKKQQIFIPYRDSVLTWLLKDSLGGNSKTTMIATISPADVNYGETLSTLHYASRTKNIVNTPTVNEDSTVKTIRGLQAEVARLQRLLEEASQVSQRKLSSPVKVKEELHENQAKEATVALRKEGSGVVLDCQLPHLIGIDEDLLSTGVILYYLKEGRTTIGSNEALCIEDIVLHGPGLLSEHCVLENQGGTVTLIPLDGALCLVNGSAASDPCPLTQGAILQLGKGIMFRFNHPTEAAQLRKKQQSGLLSAISLSLTDKSKSAENLSKVMLQNTGLMEGKCTQQEKEWQQAPDWLNNYSQGVKGFTQKNRRDSHLQRAEEESKGAETEEGGCSLMDMSAMGTDTAGKKLITTAIRGKYPVPHTAFELDGGAVQGGVSTRDGPEQERDSCHKSGPELTSERPWRKAESGAGVPSYRGEVWSGDASLQQTGVLGPGDGCGMKPGGDANEIQGVMADCYKGRPGSGGSSLGSVSHLQSTGGTSSMSVLPQTSTHSQFDIKPLNSQGVCRPPKETTYRDQFTCGGMDESRGLKEEIPGVCVTTCEAAAVQSSGLGSLVNTVSWIVQDAGRLLRSSSVVLQKVIEEGLHPVAVNWSSHMVSLVKESKVMSVVKDSCVFSLVKRSCVTSLFSDGHIFSMVKDLPLIQYIQMEISQHLHLADGTRMIQGCVGPDTEDLPELPPKQESDEMATLSLIQYDICTINGRIESPQAQAVVDTNVKHTEKLMVELQQGSESEVSYVSGEKEQVSDNSLIMKSKDVKIFCQALITYPESLQDLKTLSLLDLVSSLQSVIPTSVFTSQKTVALFWVNVTKCVQPEAHPALLLVMETGLYTLTSMCGRLQLFHHFPLLQLKEVQIGFAGHSVCLMGTTEESILGVYTYSQRLTKELCLAILGVLCPGDSRVSQHPLLHGDLMRMSLDWQVYVPDLLLDAGLRVYCHFQKNLADLVYLFHGSMDKEKISLGAVQLILYVGVSTRGNTNTYTERLAQLFLTNTHLGLVEEDVVFHPPPHSVTVELSRLQFHDLTLHQLSDVRCVVVHDEDERGAVTVDVILANVKARGHPESVTEAAIPSVHTSHSASHAEVWKLTFSCSTEAACLINHLSNV